MKIKVMQTADDEAPYVSPHVKHKTMKKIRAAARRELEAKAEVKKSIWERVLAAIHMDAPTRQHQPTPPKTRDRIRAGQKKIAPGKHRNICLDPALFPRPKAKKKARKA